MTTTTPLLIVLSSSWYECCATTEFVCSSSTEIHIRCTNTLPFDFIFFQFKIISIKSLQSLGCLILMIQYGNYAVYLYYYHKADMNIVLILHHFVNHLQITNVIQYLLQQHQLIIIDQGQVRMHRTYHLDVKFNCFPNVFNCAI